VAKEKQKAVFRSAAPRSPRVPLSRSLGRSPRQSRRLERRQRKRSILVHSNPELGFSGRCPAPEVRRRRRSRLTFVAGLVVYGPAPRLVPPRRTTCPASTRRLPCGPFAVPCSARAARVCLLLTGASLTAPRFMDLRLGGSGHTSSRLPALVRRRAASLVFDLRAAAAASRAAPSANPCRASGARRVFGGGRNSRASRPARSGEI